MRSDFTSRGIIGNMFFVWSPLRKPPSSPRNYCTWNHVFFRSQLKSINSPACFPTDCASGLPTIWKTTLVWIKMSLKTPFNLHRVTVSPGRAGAPYHGSRSATGWWQGQQPLPHSWCTFPHPVPRDVAEDGDKLCPPCGHRSWAVMLWTVLEAHGEAWRRLHCIPPTPCPCQAQGCDGWAERLSCPMALRGGPTAPPEGHSGPSCSEYILLV